MKAQSHAGVYTEHVRPALYEVVAEHIKTAPVGWFQGRMEPGPRALGARSIIVSAHGHAES